MIALIQRVRSASVQVDHAIVGAIDQGLLALIAVERGDDERSAERLLDKLLAYRVFDDAEGKMNRSLREVGGGLLLVSQFTLAADTRKGLRPSFDPAAPPDEARARFEALVERARVLHPKVATGCFGAAMQVHLINDGPVTFWLRVPPPGT